MCVQFFRLFHSIGVVLGRRQLLLKTSPFLTRNADYLTHKNLELGSIELNPPTSLSSELSTI